MISRSQAKLLVLGLFGGGLLLSLGTHCSGVIANDPDRNIWIPDELTMPLELQVACNQVEVLLRYRWPTDHPKLYIDMLRFDGERWVHRGGSPVGHAPTTAEHRHRAVLRALKST